MAGKPRAADRDWTIFRVGLTGGIASGKTTVADMFAALGVPVIDADQLARDVVAPGTPGLEAVLREFGPEFRRPDGTLDRLGLRALVFADPERRRRLEAMLHPSISRALEAASRQAGGPYQLLVVPLLFESGLDRRVDRVLVVDCPEELQRTRLLQRDGETPAGVERLLAAQLDRASRLDRADDMVRNTGTPEDTRRQVVGLHQRYLELAGGPGSEMKQGGLKGAG